METKDPRVVEVQDPLGGLLERAAEDPGIFARNAEHLEERIEQSGLFEDEDEDELPPWQPPLDEDLEALSHEQLVAEVKRLRAGIRHHRDASGHDLCWYHPELWGLLPDRLDPQPKIPPVGEFLERCAAYRATLDNAIISPIRWVPGKGLCFIEFVETGP